VTQEGAGRPEPDADPPSGDAAAAATPATGGQGSAGAASLDEELEELLSDLENPELFSLRSFFNMC
jgi:hypothetical protein